jgi:hypothetical protein
MYSIEDLQALIQLVKDGILDETDLDYLGITEEDLRIVD